MKRIGIFGWGIVAPKSPNIETFEKNLDKATNWLVAFSVFGPCNFLVGEPDFIFSDYKSWIENRFRPRKYSQLEEKMGNMSSTPLVRLFRPSTRIRVLRIYWSA